MSRKLYLIISGIIFGLVTCLHLARLILGWQVQFETVIIPFWVSWFGLVGAGILCGWAFSQIKGK